VFAKLSTLILTLIQLFGRTSSLIYYAAMANNGALDLPWDFQTKRMGTQALAIARLEGAFATGKRSPSMRTLRKYAAAVGKKMELHLAWRKSLCEVYIVRGGDLAEAS
jgi:hypothetical protein